MNHSLNLSTYPHYTVHTLTNGTVTATVYLSEKVTFILFLIIIFCFVLSEKPNQKLKLKANWKMNIHYFAG